MSSELAPYIDKGLTEDEAKQLKHWIDRGKPGLAKFRADRFADVYVLGYSCQDINKWFPEYPLETILWARVHFDWDAIREQYKTVRTKEVLETAMGAREEGIRFLTEVLHATHYRWRKQLLDYLANPEDKKPPDCLPGSLSQYSNLVQLMNEMLGMASPKDGKPGSKDNAGSPLVSVTINEQKKADIVVAGPESIKDALIQDVNNAERIQRS